MLGQRWYWYHCVHYRLLPLTFPQLPIANSSQQFVGPAASSGCRSASIHKRVGRCFQSQRRMPLGTTSGPNRGRQRNLLHSRLPFFPGYLDVCVSTVSQKDHIRSEVCDPGPPYWLLIDMVFLHFPRHTTATKLFPGLFSTVVTKQ